MVAKSVIASALYLKRQGRLLQYFRELKGTYAIVQINLFLSLRRHGDKQSLAHLARRILWNRVYNDIDFDQLPWKPFRWVGKEHLDAALARGKGVVLCTQHVGPYRRVFFELLRRDLPVNLMVSAQVARSIQFQFQRRRVEAKTLARLRIINAEQPGSVRDALTALGRNEPLLVYLDGNTGVDGPGGNRQSASNTVEVEFFGQQLAMRRGVCQIAHACGAALVPLFARWEAGRQPAMEFMEPLLHDGRMPLREFCAQGMQQLFRLSEAHIRNYPEQFEEWVRMHRWRVRPLPGELPQGLADSSQATHSGRIEELTRYRLVPDRILMLTVNKEHVLVDGVHGRVLQASPVLRELVSVLSRRATTLSELAKWLGRRHSRSQLAAALRRLESLEILEEVS